MAPPTVFTIDGTNYELPTGDSLTMKEMLLPYRYAAHSGVTGDEIPHIFFMLGALHAGIARTKPKTSAAEIEERLLGLTSAELAGLQEAWLQAGDDEDDADPPPVPVSGDETSSPVSGSTNDSEPIPENGNPHGSGDPTSLTISAFAQET